MSRLIICLFQMRIPLTLSLREHLLRRGAEFKMSKREFPFEEFCPMQLKTYVSTNEFEKSNNMENIHARTLEALRDGMERYESGEIEEEISNESINCDRCSQTKTGRGVKCAFCERNACGDCRRQCAHCDKMFCLLCLVTNYDERYERYFCLGNLPE